jgi:hypothetical protein
MGESSSNSPVWANFVTDLPAMALGPWQAVLGYASAQPASMSIVDDQENYL